MCLSLVTKHDLIFASTFDVPFHNEKREISDNMTTRTAWGISDVKTQIDSILCSRKMCCDQFVLLDKKVINSDHDCLIGSFNIGVDLPRRVVRCAFPGWTFDLSDETSAYLHDVCSFVCVAGGPSDLLAVHRDSICRLSEGIAVSAIARKHTCKKQRLAASLQLPTQIGLLHIQFKRGAKGTSERKPLFKERKTQLSKFSACTCTLIFKSPFVVPSCLEVDKDQLSCDREHWRDQLERCCRDKYSGVSLQTYVLDAYNRYASIATSQRLDGLFVASEELTLRDIVEAKVTLNMGTSSGGGSGIVTEMLSCFPLVLCFWILAAFRARFLGLADAPISWCLNVLSFLAKCLRPVRLEQYRGIAQLDCLSTLYMSALLGAIARRIKKPRCAAACCFAYAKGRSCAEIVFIINSNLRVSYDWRGGAIVSFSRATSRPRLIRVLCSRYVSRCWLLACHIVLSLLISESRSRYGRMPHFCGLSVEVEFEGTLTQGGRGGPFCLSVLFLYLLSMLHTC